MTEQQDFNYRKELEINMMKLEHEWSQQPLLFSKWADAHSASVHEVDLLKQQLEVEEEMLDRTKAEVDLDIRTHPDKLPIKLTEATVAAYITTDAKVQKQKDKINKMRSELVEAKYRMGLLGNARDAFVQRKDALQEQGRLFLGKYWSMPSAKGLTDRENDALKKTLKEKLEGDKE